jgi:hypothetical protein
MLPDLEIPIRYRDVPNVEPKDKWVSLSFARADDMPATPARDRKCQAVAATISECWDANLKDIVGTPLVPDRTRIAPFTVDGRTLRAWMRGADLKAPKWKTAAVQWPEPRQVSLPIRGSLKSDCRVMVEVAKHQAVNISSAVALKLISRERAEQAPRYHVMAQWLEMPPQVTMTADKARYNVSAASVARAKVQAGAVQSRTQDLRWHGANHRRIAELIREIGKSWKAPAVEQIEYAMTIAMLLDNLLTETGIATERRVYDAEELAMLSRWTRGLFSQIRYDAGPFWTGRKGILEGRTAPHWHYIDRSIIVAASESDLHSAFSRMLHRSAEINSKIRSRCNAAAMAPRAYQAAAIVRDSYLHGLRVSATDVISAGIVIEAISQQLRRPGRIDWSQRTATLDLLEGVSSHEAADRFGRDPSSLRERLDSETVAIEARFGRYCNELWEPPQKQNRPCYNSNVDGRSAPEPWPASRYLTPSDRAALVLHYVELASGKPHLKWGNGKDPLAWIYESAWLRIAYKLIAQYIEAGGPILTGYLPQRHLPEKWHVDRRSASRLREDNGLDPLDGLVIPQRYANEFDQMKRVFRSVLIEDVIESQSGIAT